MLCCVVGNLDHPDIWKEHIASLQGLVGPVIIGPSSLWRWRCHVPLKCQDILNFLLNSVTIQKTRILFGCSIWESDFLRVVLMKLQVKVFALLGFYAA